ncbi:Proteolipid protein 2 [Elasticomyces elasticus]|nr:Proteolipid protein 2 [Elasticomyces elasticus]KAK3640210.1 Proteolipid protein 2 [Elasticomyces elasticus]KAK4913273.1 Proteolipid protein 2 [Elasticomyces elasticus]KAK5751355.1 Proteolipid protein 2 [Elasticomyces elasticus]
MDPNQQVQVPIDDPNADTEWNDILRKHGVIPEKPPSPTPMIEEALTQARQLAHENRLEGKDLEELDELEEDEDAAFLDSYRAKRIAEMNSITTASVYGQVYPVQKPEYPVAVTEESMKAWVCVLLTSSSGMNVESQRLVEVWRELATKWGDIKFVQMRAELCIEGYPDKNTPTVLMYRDGEIRRQIVTLKELGGDRTGSGEVEQLLIGLGAIKHGDPRLKKKGEDDGDEEGREREGRSVRGSKRGVSDGKDEDEGDSDWE